MVDRVFRSMVNLGWNHILNSGPLCSRGCLVLLGWSFLSSLGRAWSIRQIAHQLYVVFLLPRSSRFMGRKDLPFFGLPWHSYGKHPFGPIKPAHSRPRAAH